MISTPIEVNDAQFQDMLQRYVSVSSKIPSDACNKKMGDWMLTSARFAPKADRAEIDNLFKKPWWYPFVQKVLNIRGVTETVRRRVRKGEGKRASGGVFEESHRWQDLSNGRIYNVRRTKGETRIYAGGQTRKNIGRVSRIITRRRRKGVAYFKALFTAAGGMFGKDLGARLHDKNRSDADKLESFGFKSRGVVATIATPASAVALARIPLKTGVEGSWPGGTRPGVAQDLQAKSGIAARTMQAAMAYQVEDMAKYIARRLNEGARQAGFQVAA